METRGTEPGRIVVSASPDELRLMLAALNEMLNGPFAIPDADWDNLVGQPPARASALADELYEILAADRR